MWRVIHNSIGEIKISYVRLHSAVMEITKLAALREHKQGKLKFTFPNIKDLPLSITKAPPDDISLFSCDPYLPK